MPMDTEQEILQARAKKLSETYSKIQDSARVCIPMVEFSLTPHKYCLQFDLLKEVMTLKDLTVIPGVPSYIQGIINIRGRVMSLMNLRKFLGMKETGITEQNKVMIVGHQGLEIGILVDRIGGVFNLSDQEIDPALPNLGGQQSEFVKGISKQGMIVIDFSAMLESKKIIVQ